MIHDIVKPEISPDFTIDDIRKIKEWHYDMLKDATVGEQIEFYRRGSAEFKANLEKRRAIRRTSTESVA
jgi:hypothetical protein